MTKFCVQIGTNIKYTHNHRFGTPTFENCRLAVECHYRGCNDDMFDNIVGNLTKPISNPRNINFELVVVLSSWLLTQPLTTA